MSPRRGIHAADPERSARLKRVLALLSDGREHSTLDIMTRAQVCAVSAIASELRVAGHKIPCRITVEDGKRVWYYRLINRPAQLDLLAAA